MEPVKKEERRGDIADAPTRFQEGMLGVLVHELRPMVVATLRLRRFQGTTIAIWQRLKELHNEERVFLDYVE